MSGQFIYGSNQSASRFQVCLTIHVELSSENKPLFLDMLADIIEPTRAQPGCEEFNLNSSSHEPNAFELTACWSTEEALKRQLESPRFLHLFQALDLADQSPVISLKGGRGFQSLQSITDLFNRIVQQDDTSHSTRFK